MRHLMRQKEPKNRTHVRRREITVSTHNVRTMAVEETNGVGQAIDVLIVFNRLGYDVIGLQDTLRSKHQPSSRLATRYTAAVSTVARIVGRKCKVKSN